MKTNELNKDFDAVEMMREIRDKITSETQNMTFEELQSYIGNQLDKDRANLVG